MIFIFMNTIRIKNEFVIKFNKIEVLLTWDTFALVQKSANKCSRLAFWFWKQIKMLLQFDYHFGVEGQLKLFSIFQTATIISLFIADEQFSSLWYLQFWQFLAYVGFLFLKFSFCTPLLWIIPAYFIIFLISHYT